MVARACRCRQPAALDALDSLPSGLADATQTALAETAVVLARVRRRIAGRRDEPASPLSAEDVFALLDKGQTSLPALEEAAQTGRFEAPSARLPRAYDAAASRSRPRTHGRCALAARCRSHRRARARATLARFAAAVEQPRALQVAALAHDVGKSVAGADHPEAGRLARSGHRLPFRSRPART